VNIHVHLLSHDHEPILKWSIRHYRTFANRIVVHDGGPDHTQKIHALTHGCEVLEWETGGQLNDELAMKLKNECWIGTDADWVIVADADELIYFPQGATLTIAGLEDLGAAMIKPQGYEMFSDELPPEKGQIYETIKDGARDDKWYAKPILFSPARISETEFGLGAHEADPVMKNGKQYHVGANWPISPDVYLLHFHQIGGLQRIAERYDATRKRLSRVNEQHLWGNFKPGLEHAQEKRDYILPRLQSVIP
jgi:glycosyl transferase family 2